MLSLYDVEAVSPGHINTRLTSLTRMREELLAQGYDVKPISMNNLECFWLTVEYKGVTFHLDDGAYIGMYTRFIDNG